MKHFGIAGWSGSGKTTLLFRLIPALVCRGIRVATVKHTHHAPHFGDDEMRALAASGAVETVVAGAERWALAHELPPGGEPALAALAAKVAGADLLLVEGFKFSPHAKLEVFDPSLGKRPLAPDDPSVVAIACDQPLPGCGLPVFARGDIEGIAGFITRYCRPVTAAD
ncbi:MAG: molybdopterin-guanine dinucleotide biosynthesis protein B [Solirubrobacterales bacterium]